MEDGTSAASAPRPLVLHREKMQHQLASHLPVGQANHAMRSISCVLSFPTQQRLAELSDECLRTQIPFLVGIQADGQDCLSGAGVSPLIRSPTALDPWSWVKVDHVHSCPRVTDDSEVSSSRSAVARHIPCLLQAMPGFTADLMRISKAFVAKDFSSLLGSPAGRLGCEACLVQDGPHVRALNNPCMVSQDAWSRRTQWPHPSGLPSRQPISWNQMG